MDQTQIDYSKGIIESILFVSDKPVTVEQFRQVMPEITPDEIERIIKSLKEDVSQKVGGMIIAEIAGGFQMLSNPSYAGYIRSFYKTRTKEKLSRPSLETLAIIAYKQPVSRADIELVRGVNSDGVMAHLLSKALVKIVGRKEVPGRPFLYGTTKEFLEYFGLKSLDDLPKLDEFPALSAQSELIPPELPFAQSAELTAEERQQEESLKESLDAFEEAAESQQNETSHANTNEMTL
jgi:segregation and condensation protein B